MQRGALRYGNVKQRVIIGAPRYDNLHRDQEDERKNGTPRCTEVYRGVPRYSTPRYDTTYTEMHQDAKRYTEVRRTQRHKITAAHSKGKIASGCKEIHPHRRATINRIY